MVIVNDSYLIAAKILVGEFFGLPDGDAFIELREPDTRTMFKLEAAFRSRDNGQIIDTFLAALPGLIVSHSLMKNEKEALLPGEVAEVVARKLELFMHILTEYKEKVLFTLGKKSGEK
jgi:hypothetical protein